MLEIIKHTIGAIILITTSIIFSIIILNEKKIKFTKKKIIILLIGVMIYCLILEKTVGTIKTLLIFLFHIIQFRYLLKVPYSDSVFLTFLYIVLTIVPDTLFLLFLMNVLKIPPEICYSKYTDSIIATISVCAMLLIMAFIFRKLLRRIIKIKIDNNKLILIYTILTFGCVIAIFYKATDIVLISKYLVEGIIIMLVFVIILYSLIRQKMENDKIVEKYDKLLEFIKKYEIIIEEQREARHESKNQLITIKSKVLNKDKEQEIIKYVDSILKDHIGYQEDKYGKFQYLPANGIKGLFYYKSMEAEEKGINLSINIGKRVENSIISKLDTEEFKQLGRILGVYLDNAIEASSISEEKKLGIEVYMHKKDVVIIISNTYKGEIDEESIGKVKYTTKGTNHGYGLMLVNKILSKNNRFHSERQVTNKLYIQKITIKKSI